MELKYIITGHGVIVFKEGVMHNEAAHGFNVESAGFFRLSYQDGKFICNPYGESVSLGIKSNPETDKIRLEMFFNGRLY